MLLPDICRRVGAQTLLIPLIDMYSPAWHLSSLSGPPSPVFLLLLSPFLLRHQSTDSQPRHATMAWEDISFPQEDIPEWQRLQKILQSNLDLLSCLNWEVMLCQTELTTYHSLCLPSLHLGTHHSSSEISGCQNPTHQVYINISAEQFDKIKQRWRWHNLGPSNSTFW